MIARKLKSLYLTCSVLMVLCTFNIVVGQDKDDEGAKARAEAREAAKMRGEARAAALNARAKAQAGENDAAKEAYNQLLGTIKSRELIFVMRVCKLEAEQRERAEKIGMDLKTEAAKDAKEGQDPMVVNGRLMRQGQIRVRMGNGQVMADKSVVTKFQQKLRDSLRALMTPDQLKIYNEELEAKQQFARRANAECLVAILDHKLSLSPEQTQPLIESLMEWEEADELQLSFYLQQSSENYVPPIPLKFYAKVLNQNQRKIFESAQQVSVQRNQFLDVENAW